MIRALCSGTLHADPVARTSATGNQFVTAKIRADGKDGNATWCSLIAFGDVGERLATLKAGASLSVSGRCELSAWLSRDGEAKAGLSIVADEIVTLRGQPKSKPSTHKAVDAIPFDDDLAGICA